MSSITSLYLCGVTVRNPSCTEIEDVIGHFLTDGASHYVVTVNPEMLHRAVHEPHFAGILNAADLHVIDGFGISCAFFYHRGRVLCRMTGVELMWQLVDRADRNDLMIFLAANAFGLTLWQEMADVIHDRYPRVRINGANIDPHKPQLDSDVRADIMLCNFGAPQQEYFLQACTKRHIFKVGVGVGGAFDFATGRITRAPRWMRRCGCEWLWRLIKQPSRWRRIMRAVIIFPWYVVRGK